MDVDGGAKAAEQGKASGAPARRVAISPQAQAEEAAALRRKAIEQSVMKEVAEIEKESAQQPASGRLVPDSQTAG